MANDLVIRLKAENKELKRAFGDSTKEIGKLKGELAKVSASFAKMERDSKRSFSQISKEIQSSIPSIGSLAGGLAKIGTVAGGIGLAAKGLQSLATTALGSGQTIDEFNNRLNAAKGTFELFAYSILNGQNMWDALSGNIYRANKELSELRDSFFDISGSYSMISSEAQAALAELQEVVNDKTVAKNVKIEKLTVAKAEYDKAEKVSEKLIANAKKQFEKAFKGKGLTIDSDKAIAAFTVRDEYDDIYAEEQKRIRKYNAAKLRSTNPRSKVSEKEAARKIMQENAVSKFTDEQLALAEAIHRFSDKERTELETLFTKIQGNKSSIGGMGRGIVRATNTITKVDKSTATDIKKEIEPLIPGSSAYIENEIKKINDQIAKEPQPIIVAKLQIDKEDLEKELKSLQSSGEQFRNLFKGIPVTFNDEVKESAKKLQEKYALNKDKAPEIKQPALETPGTGIGKELVEKYNNDAIIEQINSYRGLADSLRGVAEASGEAGEGVAGVLQILSSIGSALPDLLPMIQAIGNGFSSMFQTTAATAATAANGALSISNTTVAATAIAATAAQQQLSNANITEAGSAAVATGANAGLAASNLTEAGTAAAAGAGNAIKSSAILGPIGWITGIAAALAIVGTMISVVSSLKFAKGGIVPGTSFSGDKIPAFLNSGEMVLNRQQQEKLFNMINSGSDNFNISRKVDLYNSLSPQNQVIELKGELVGRGADLKAIIKNVDRKFSI